MKNIPEKRTRKGPKWLRERTIEIAEERWEAKQVGNRTEVRCLYAKFHSKVREEKERLKKDKYHDLEEKKRDRNQDICSGQLESSLDILLPKQVHSKVKLEN